MMNALTQRLSALLQRGLSEKCSSAAYAIMIDGQIIAEDSMGRNPIREALKSGAPLEKLLVEECPSIPLDFQKRTIGIPAKNSGIILRPFNGGAYGAAVDFRHAGKLD